MRSGATTMAQRSSSRLMCHTPLPKWAPISAWAESGRVQETGTVGVVTVSTPSNTFATHLLVADSTAFDNTTQEIALSDDGAGNLTATVNFTNGQFFSFGRDLLAPGCVAAGNPSCNLVQNGDFWKGNLSNWTNSGNWLYSAQAAPHGGTAYYNNDGGTTQTLSQNVSGLNSAVSGGNITLTVDVYRDWITTASALTIKLGGFTVAGFNQTSPTAATLTAGAGVTASPTTVANELLWTSYTFTIPFAAIGGADSALLEFTFSAGTSDYLFDNVSIIGQCPASLALWLRADALSGADASPVPCGRI